MLSDLIQRALREEAGQTKITPEDNERLFRSLCDYMDEHRHNNDPPNREQTAASPPADKKENRS